MAIKGEFLHNNLLAIELALVVSIKLIGHLGTVVRMGTRGGLDGIVTRGCALISLDMGHVSEGAGCVIAFHTPSFRMRE